MSPYTVILIGFVVLAAVAVGLDALGRGGRRQCRPLSEALDAVMSTRVGRWLTLGAWVWIGLHFLAR
jgi:hypothetical protein